MELAITFLQMTLSCISGLKILMKPNIGFHLSCLTWKIWIARRKLKLNDGKTEIIVIRGNLRNVSVANFGVMSFGDTQLVPCDSTKNFGVVLDSSLRFRSHIDSIVKTCNFHIRNLYMIKVFVNRKKSCYFGSLIVCIKGGLLKFLIHQVP